MAWFYYQATARNGRLYILKVGNISVVALFTNIFNWMPHDDLNCLDSCVFQKSGAHHTNHQSEAERWPGEGLGFGLRIKESVLNRAEAKSLSVGVILPSREPGVLQQGPGSALRLGLTPDFVIFLSC